MAVNFGCGFLCKLIYTTKELLYIKRPGERQSVESWDPTMPARLTPFPVLGLTQKMDITLDDHNDTAEHSSKSTALALKLFVN